MYLYSLEKKPEHLFHSGPHGPKHSNKTGIYQRLESTKIIGKWQIFVLETLLANHQPSVVLVNPLRGCWSKIYFTGPEKGLKEAETLTTECHDAQHSSCSGSS